MRYIIYGAGAIGCTIGAHLFRQGHNVVLVGREAHVNKINQDGLRFATGDDTGLLNIPAVTSAESLAPFTDEDVLLLCVKSHHTVQCLGELKAAGAPRHLPIVCCQNSIWNEGACARAFHRVYGMSTVMPALYLEAGEVLNPMTIRYGMAEIGCFPAGVDARAERIAADLAGAGFTANTHSDVMMVKAAKCLGNLANVVRALIGEENEGEQLIEKLRDEAMRVWRACGIEWEDYHDFRGRVRAHPGQRKVPDGYEDTKILGSSWQSLQRGAGSIETELLNGEIAFLGKLVGIQTPYNQLVNDLAAQMVRENALPGRYSEAELLAMPT
jgi:2-dehydropantoate 2-reductase